ncbi:MAG TPA: hypothetical protein VI136_15455 [Verrucomicrobiae bacterium]
MLVILLAAAPLNAKPLRVAAFSCDATPPLGEPMIWAIPLQKVVTPLLAKGVVLEDGTNRYVLCAFDWCLIGNESGANFRETLARAARTSPTRVSVHTVHQHVAPYADEGAHRLLDAAPRPPAHLSAAYLEGLRARLEATVRQAVGRLQPFDRIGTGEAQVERVASIRRLRDADGKPLVRYSSSGKDLAMAEAPEGDIDPMLKTITFARGRKALARLHYYATHPQTVSCNGTASADFVGAAREAVEHSEQVPQVYFNGCAGDVTVGKYNDGSPEACAGLQQRLEAALRAAIQNTRFARANQLVWRTAAVNLPLRAERDAVLAESRAWLADTNQNDGMRVYKGAMRLAFVNRLERPLEVSSLQLGDVMIVNLPGEPMLAFQRYAQSLRPGRFVAVAGYGDAGPAYICTDAAIAEGGYEPGSANVGQDSERILKEAMRKLFPKPAVRMLSPAASPH